LLNQYMSHHLRPSNSEIFSLQFSDSGSTRREGNSSRLQYAVIQVRESDSGIERLVIGYQDEWILRQFLAKRSIVATGFSTRDEATKKSFTAGIGNCVPLSNFTCRFRVSPSCYQVRTLTMRALSRLKGRVGALELMNNVVHIAGAALHTIQSRLTHARRGLEPAVQ
jgi:hypothetical protein